MNLQELKRKTPAELLAFAEELQAHLVAAVRDVGKQVEKKSYLHRPWHVRTLSWIAYGLMRLALFATRHRY